ncbi:hypothetical protein OPV22_019951 [Ensete ventricosum]|uniref:Uncharacterized protein n=1 Tax=Ensete ventricosum TaxID=4639 RepID=A0AAV8Q8Z6_ENSVE|nr:hypothetical protein OPV22_019951 [Ensete ventricosum]
MIKVTICLDSLLAAIRTASSSGYCLDLLRQALLSEFLGAEKWSRWIHGQEKLRCQQRCLPWVHQQCSPRTWKNYYSEPEERRWWKMAMDYQEPGPNTYPSS